MDKLNLNAFTTNNTALAVALLTAGVPLLSVNNNYDKDTLERIGAANMSQAIEMGRPGMVAYSFRRENGFTEVVKAFNEQNDKRPDQTTHLPKADPEDVARIVAVAMKNRAFLQKAWRQVEPVLIARDVRGNVTGVSRNASKETKRRLGV